MAWPASSGMYEYRHGGNAAYETGNEGVIDLSASINPLGAPENVREAIAGAIAGCARYPDSSSARLRERLAEYENVSPGQIFCGNGASDIIFRLPKASRAASALVTAPAFSDYERSAASGGLKIIRHALSPENGFAVDTRFMETAMEAKPGLVFLCNPNNPTGRLIEKRTVAELLKRCEGFGALVAIDECFLGFAKRRDEFASVPLTQSHKNLIVIKAFTKLFALPGIRLGYAICSDADIIGGLYAHGCDWPVSNLAQAAGVAALTGVWDYVDKTAEFVSREREFLESGLSRMGFQVFPAAANYVFFRNPFPFDLREELDKKGIRVRSCGDFHGLDKSYCRAAVSGHENNRLFLDAAFNLTKKYIQKVT